MAKGNSLGIVKRLRIEIIDAAKHENKKDNMKKHGKNSLSSYLDKYCPLQEYEEKWIYIDGEKSIYKVRSNGEIVSTEYQGRKRKKPHIMIGGIDKDGYRLVCLTHKHKKHTYKVHRLVAEAFIPNLLNKPEVNHIDGNHLNNNISNLEWCYPSENTHHAIRTGLRKATNNEESIDTACSLIESNQYSLNEITYLTGVDRITLLKILRKSSWVSISKKYNIDNFNPEDHKEKVEYKKIPDIVIHGICDELCKNKLSISEISKLFNVKIQTVWKVLHHETRTDISCEYNFNAYSMKHINQFK